MSFKLKEQCAHGTWAVDGIIDTPPATELGLEWKEDLSMGAKTMNIFRQLRKQASKLRIPVPTPR